MGSVRVSALLKVTYSCIGDERMRKEAGEGARLAGMWEKLSENPGKPLASF
jgi:hypothetical protein